MMNRSEIIFEVTEAPEGGYDAWALGHSVFTQGEDWDDLRVRQHYARDKVHHCPGCELQREGDA